MAVSACNGGKSTSDDVSSAGPKSMQQQRFGSLRVNILPETPTSGDDLQAVLSDGGAVAWRWERNGRIIDNERTSRLAKRHFVRGDTIAVIVTTGGKEGKALVGIANALPVVRSIRLTPEYISRGEDVTVVADVYDPDGDDVGISCAWNINSDEYQLDSLVLPGDRIKKGDRVSATITPSDKYGKGKPFSTQTFTIPNGSPWFVSTPPSLFSGNIYTYAAEARDPDGDPVTYTLVSFPEGMIIDRKSGQISWKISSAHVGSHTIEIQAEDNEGAKGSQKYSLNITLP